MSIKVGRWDCGSCGHKMILGPETQCPKCDSSRPKNVKFYLPTNAEIVKNKEELKKAKAGADWVCSSCGTHNKNWESTCNNCTNPRKIAVGEDTELETKFHDFDAPEEEQDEFAKHYQRSPYNDWRQYGYVRLYNGNENTYPAFIRILIKKIRTIGMLVLGGIAMLVSFVLKQDIDVKVEQVKWERTISYEEFREVEEEAWELPKNGQLIEEFQAVHHTDKQLQGYETKTRTVKVYVGTEQYVCGTTDLGNGYFEDVFCNRDIYENRQEEYEAPIYVGIPVYKTKYKYTIFRWKKAEPLKTEGLNKTPRWADRSIFSQSQSYRETGTNEEYFITVIGPKGKRWQHQLTYDYWKSIKIGTKVKAEKYRLWGSYIGLKEGVVD